MDWNEIISKLPQEKKEQLKKIVQNEIYNASEHEQEYDKAYIEYLNALELAKQKEQDLINVFSKYNRDCLKDNLSLLNKVYWDSNKELSKKLIVSVKLSSQIKKLINPQVVTGKCSICKKEFTYSLIGKSDKKTRCPGCEKKRLITEAFSDTRKGYGYGYKYYLNQPEDTFGRQEILDIFNKLHNMSYKSYLLTDEWNTFRKDVLKKNKYTCKKCGAKNCELHVHHLTYDNRGYETYKDVIVLCKDCHEKEHNILPPLAIDDSTFTKKQIKKYYDPHWKEDLDMWKA